MSNRIDSRPGPCSYGGPCYWYSWEVRLHGCVESGDFVDGLPRARRQVRRAERRIARWAKRNPAPLRQGEGEK